jgi:hypothetical protein
VPKTKAEVVAEAHRRISVLSVDESLSPDQAEYGGTSFEALFSELNEEPHKMGFTFTTETVPDALYRPLAWLLAVDLAAHHVVPPVDTRARAMGRVRAYAFPDDRTDRRDTNEDGVISEEEADYGARAAFY